MLKAIEKSKRKAMMITFSSVRGRWESLSGPSSQRLRYLSGIEDVFCMKSSGSFPFPPKVCHLRSPNPAHPSFNSAIIALLKF